MINTNEAKRWQWLVRVLDPKNSIDKKAIDHLNAGFCYYLLAPPSAMQKFYIVGYKHFGGPIPYYAEPADELQSKRLDELDTTRYYATSLL